MRTPFLQMVSVGPGGIVEDSPDAGNTGELF